MVDLDASEIVGIVAGVLVASVGLFVLLARPASWLHRLFFLLALFDGASTILFRASGGPDDPTLQLLLRGLFYHYQIAFVTLLGLFVALFPFPPRWPRLERPLAAAAVLLGLGLLATYTLRHDLFFTAQIVDGDVVARPEPLGNLVNALFLAFVGIGAVKVTYLLRVEPSPSHRRQAAWVLGGMSLAYGPFAATALARALATDPAAALLTGRPDRVLTYWTFALALLALAASAYLLARDAREDHRNERRFLHGCYAVVAGMSVLSLTIPTEEVALFVRGLGLLAYPTLLGYAIVRFEVFDIDRHLRRAATVTLATGGIAATFVVAQNTLEEVLQDLVFDGLPSAWVGGSAAALATAALGVPIVGLARRVGRRIVPALTIDELHQRKLEVYRHGLAGALADGIVAPHESRTLQALRESLGISDAEHDTILAQVRRETPGLAS